MAWTKAKWLPKKKSSCLLLPVRLACEKPMGHGLKAWPAIGRCTGFHCISHWVVQKYPGTRRAVRLGLNPGLESPKEKPASSSSSSESSDIMDTRKTKSERGRSPPRSPEAPQPEITTAELPPDDSGCSPASMPIGGGTGGCSPGNGLNA